MSISIKTALKFILSKKNKTFINFLSYISILTLSLGTAAMIIVLSVYNGLENTLKSIYDDFDPEIKIEKKEFKYFENSLASEIASIENVESVSAIIENQVILQNEEKEAVAYLKGVDENFISQERISNNLTEGSFLFKIGKMDYGVFGRGIKYKLGLKTNSNFQSVDIFALNENKSLNPSSLKSNFFYKEGIKVSGIFAIENSFDNEYVFSSLKFAQRLFKNDKISSYEVKLKDKNKISETRQLINSKIGDNYNILTSLEQRLGLYKILKTEKLVVYLVFGIILLLSSINIFFLLIMMGVEKQKDISVMYSFGVKREQIKNVFINQGLLIGAVSIIFGTIIGTGLTLLQKEFGLIKIQMSSSILEKYPVDFMFSDLLVIYLMVLSISYLASLFPGIISSRQKNFININKVIS